MRSRFQTAGFPTEIGDFSAEVRQIFLELGRNFGSESLAGECAPPVDVYETDDTLEISMDLPGVNPAAIRVIGKGGSLLIAGEKAARRGRSDSTFHLVERGYGRFARVIRLERAVDTSKARARLLHGELRISMPKIADRRGAAITIGVDA